MAVNPAPVRPARQITRGLAHGRGIRPSPTPTARGGTWAGPPGFGSRAGLYRRLRELRSVLAAHGLQAA